MPTDIQALIDAIPIAEDGHVITSEYHNKLRDALRALAGLGESPASQSKVLSLAPAFFSDIPSEVWEHPPGRAQKSLPAAASGWFPVEIPDGARIQKMEVACRKTGTTGVLTVRLVKQPLFSENPVVVAEVIFQRTPPPPVSVPIDIINPIDNVFARTTDESRSIASVAVLPGGITFELFDPTIRSPLSSTINSQHIQIDNRNHKYFIDAKLQAVTGATATPQGVTHVLAVQLFYTL